MKKSLVIFAVLLITFKSFAQTDQKFHFGLKAAPALVWFKSDTKGLSSDGTRLGFIYGLVTEFNFGKNYAFATGLEVAYRGGKFKQSLETPGLTVVSSITEKLEYLEIPITLKFKTNEIGAMTYYLQAGIEPGFNIRARADFSMDMQSNGTTQHADSNDIDIMDGINAFNLSMVIGGGLEYRLSGNTAVLVGLSFSNGLMDVVDGSEAKANSNYLALNLGILF
jgi:opacity protein-like surface antigen